MHVEGIVQGLIWGTNPQFV